MTSPPTTPLYTPRYVQALRDDNHRLCSVLLDTMRVLRAIEEGSEDEATAVYEARIKIEEVLGLRKNSAAAPAAASEGEAPAAVPPPPSPSPGRSGSDGER